MDIGWECRCATLWCDLVLTFDLALVTLTLKIFSGPYLRNCKMQEVVSWIGHWLGSVGMLNYCVTFNLGSAKVCSPAIFDTYFSCDRDIWIAVNYYYMYFYIYILCYFIGSFSCIVKFYSFIFF